MDSEAPVIIEVMIAGGTVVMAVFMRTRLPKISVPAPVGTTAGGLFMKALLFGALCIVFSRYLEKRILDYYRGKERSPEPMLVVAGIGFIIAAVAGWLGFSLAIGALTAGLVFSRDPRSLKIDRSTILVIAPAGKLAGIGLPTFFMRGATVALLLGVSMVLRAEIALVIMQQGLAFGHWAVSPEVFSSMVFVSVAMCVTALQSLLRKRPGKSEANRCLHTL